MVVHEQYIYICCIKISDDRTSVRDTDESDENTFESSWDYIAVDNHTFDLHIKTKVHCTTWVYFNYFYVVYIQMWFISVFGKTSLIDYGNKMVFPV